jgi:hypothetical protein
MRLVATSKMPSATGYSMVNLCAMCVRPRVMSLVKICPTALRGTDMLSYRCRMCGTENAYLHEIAPPNLGLS